MKNDRPLDKNGQPYDPFTEAQMKAARNRPYPVEFTRLSEDLRRHRAERVKAEVTE